MGESDQGDFAAAFAELVKGRNRERDAELVGMFIPRHYSPPHNGTETSREAAEKIVPECDRQRDAVLAALLAAPDGLTREEIAEVTGLPGDSVRPRCWEAIKVGVVRATSDTRATRSGRRAYILKAV